MQLWHHSNGAPVGSMSLDSVFGWNIRFQILCRNQEEKDLLDAYQLMYGRDVQVDIWEDWRKPVPTFQVGPSGTGVGSARRKLLPVAFTTWPDANLRGL